MSVNVVKKYAINVLGLTTVGSLVHVKERLTGSLMSGPKVEMLSIVICAKQESRKLKVVII